MDHLPRSLVAVLATVLMAACTTIADIHPAANSTATPATTSSPASEPSTPSASSGTIEWDEPGPIVAQSAAFQLQPFSSCDALLDYYVEAARDLVGPWGLGGNGPMYFEGDVATEAAAVDSAGGRESTTAQAVGADGDGSFSGTNVQEEGVDEPDVVKTDGEVIVTVAEQGIRVVDVASAEVIGRLALPDQAWNAELLLSGDDLLVVTTGGESFGRGSATDLFPAYAPTRTTVMRVDLSDPTTPTVVGSVRMEGGYRSARMVDGTVRLVMVSEPTGLSFVQPTDGGLSAEQDALEENRRLLAQSDLDDWVPHLQVLDADGTSGEVQRLLDCGDIARPADVSGLSTLSVLTLSIDGDELVPTSGAGLVAAGDTVYASMDRLVVSTSPWGQWIQPFLADRGDLDDRELRTDLHSFDISDPSSTRYVASGSVTGTLLNQFALSETDGVIRVATTTQPDWFGGERRARESESSLVVLAERDGDLVETGRVDGLGVTERIYAVRYLGPDLAAIVTFRETDPLYLVDTSDPTDPVVTGELKIPGFSSYLHPIGDGRLVGIGQDANDSGRTLGLQASLFDVSDLTSPERVDQVTFGGGYSPVEYDHHAFLYWNATGQVVLPAELWDESEAIDAEESGRPFEPFVGAIVLEVDGSTVTEQGRVSLRDGAGGQWWGEVRRSMVIDDHLWVVAHDRLARFTLDGLDDRTVVPLG